MTRRRTWGALALAGVLAAGGCGIPDRVVGLRAAPTVPSDPAILTATAARQVSQRALDRASEAMTGPDADEAARKSALLGPALRLAEVKDKFVAEGRTNALTLPPAVTLLGVSRGPGWPRYLLATAQAEDVQSLYVFVQTDATTPFKLQTTVPMEPGASIPAMPLLTEGIQPVTDGSGLVGSPATIAKAYADALAYPAPRPPKTPIVGLDDGFAKGILASSSAQAKALGKLGTFTRSHAPFAQDVLAFRLEDGGALAFVQLSRRDTLAPTRKAKELVLTGSLAKLAGTSKITKSADLDWLETLAIVIPASGTATIVAASEQLRGITAK